MARRGGVDSGGKKYALVLLDMMGNAPRQVRWLAVLGALALFAGAAAALAALAAGPAYRLGWWPLGTAIQTLRWAAIAGLVVVALGGVAALGGVMTGTRDGVRAALLAIALGLCVAGPPLLHYERLQRLPRIHDISTDMENPPAFVAVLAQRAATRASNPTTYADETAVEQRRAYPEIAPRLLALPPAEAFAKAERAVRKMGWEIVAVDPAGYRIEATDTSLLFGFKDDVVIRVSAHGAGSRVDVRSLSRIGGHDFGVNAKRVRAYLKKLASA